MSYPAASRPCVQGRVPCMPRRSSRPQQPATTRHFTSVRAQPDDAQNAADVQQPERLSAQAEEQATSNGATGEPGNAPAAGMMDCIGTGMDVSCSVPDDGRTALADDAAEPLSAFLATCLLISPFFFWGTSMVAMKVGSQTMLSNFCC